MLALFDSLTATTHRVQDLKSHGLHHRSHEMSHPSTLVFPGSHIVGKYVLRFVQGMMPGSAKAMRILRRENAVALLGIMTISGHDPAALQLPQSINDARLKDATVDVFSGENTLVFQRQCARTVRCSSGSPMLAMDCHNERSFKLLQYISGSFSLV